MQRDHLAEAVARRRPRARRRARASGAGSDRLVAPIAGWAHSVAVSFVALRVRAPRRRTRAAGTPPRAAARRPTVEVGRVVPDCARLVPKRIATAGSHVDVLAALAGEQERDVAARGAPTPKCTARPASRRRAVVDGSAAARASARDRHRPWRRRRGGPCDALERALAAACEEARACRSLPVPLALRRRGATRRRPSAPVSTTSSSARVAAVGRRPGRVYSSSATWKLLAAEAERADRRAARMRAPRGPRAAPWC